MIPDASRITSELHLNAGAIATVMAHAMGNSVIGQDDLRRDAIQMLRIWLRREPMDIDVDSSLVECSGNKARAYWKSHVDWWDEYKSELFQPRVALSAVMLPLDGAASLYQGRAGSMCWLGVTERDSLGPLRAACRKHSEEKKHAEDSFLVLAIGRRPGLEDTRKQIRALNNTAATGRTCPLNSFLRSSPGLRGVIGMEAQLGAHTLDLTPFRFTHPLPGVYSLGRWLDGSSVVSAVAALTGRTDFGFCVCRSAALAAILGAARTLGGATLVVPIKIEGAGTGSADVVVEESARILDGELLLAPNARMILVGASITELCISDRVRWTPISWDRPRKLGQQNQTETSLIPDLMSVHAVVFDTEGAIYEERKTDWDVSRVSCLGGKSLQSLIRFYQKRWRQKYITDVTTMEQKEPFVPPPTEPIIEVKTSPAKNPEWS